jgi:thiamine-phosphate pyrophosphorylase
VIASLADARLYLCTPLREDLERFVASCLDGGVDVVQLREKERDARDVVAAATRLAMQCKERSIPFVVNDRPDVALESGADGVHVGQEDITVSACRRILGDEAIVGLSTHDESDLGAALAQDVTYLSAGPVVATPTKPGRPAAGAGYVATAVQRAGVPVFVTGGVDVASVGGLVAIGARHFVAVRALTESGDPRRAARELRTAIDEAIDEADRSAG